MEVTDLDRFPGLAFTSCVTLRNVLRLCVLSAKWGENTLALPLLQCCCDGQGDNDPTNNCQTLYIYGNIYIHVYAGIYIYTRI